MFFLNILVQVFVTPSKNLHLEVKLMTSLVSEERVNFTDEELVGINLPLKTMDCNDPGHIKIK